MDVKTQIEADNKKPKFSNDDKNYRPIRMVAYMVLGVSAVLVLINIFFAIYLMFSYSSAGLGAVLIWFIIGIAFLLLSVPVTISLSVLKKQEGLLSFGVLLVISASIIFWLFIDAVNRYKKLEEPIEIPSFFYIVILASVAFFILGFVTIYNAIKIGSRLSK